VPIDEDEARSLLRWVDRGGRLVIVDRRPEVYLLPSSGRWTIATEFLDYPNYNVDPGNIEEMTAKATPLRPAQPTSLTYNIEAVMPSRFASVINFSAAEKGSAQSKAKKEHGVDFREDEEDESSTPKSAASPDLVIAKAPTANRSVSAAPVVYLANSGGARLVDYPHGQGRIVVLTDPYIFTNAGLSLKDNLQLAINVLGAAGGLIAFDEYHQGRGITRNALVSYFSGTPVLAICGQLILVALLVLWTHGRRFARPLPLVQVDRRSSLEFVASMAELQQRARTYDLAIENVYSRIRRVLARYAGAEYNSPRSEIALRVASRSSLDAQQLETLMRQCEEAINGGPIGERESIQLVKRLRELEAKLGLRMRSREVKQAAQKI